MDSRIEYRDIATDLIDLNEGQIEGLPTNPRCWTFGDVQNLQESIRQTPELLEARGLIVYPHDGRYVVIGGNMRLTALKGMEEKKAPCIVLPEDTAIGTLRAIAIKDNGQYGSWDVDLLKAEWPQIDFASWGIDVFTTEDEVNDEKDRTVKETITDSHQLTIVFSSEEFEFENKALRQFGKSKEEALLTLLGYYDGDGTES